MEASHLASAPALAPTLESLPLAPRRALERLVSLEFRHVQLSARQEGLRPRDLDRSARRDLSATLRRLALSVSGIDVWLPPAHFLEPGRVDRAVAMVIETIELAEDLGRCPVSCALPVHEETGDIVRAMLDCADQRGVRLADHSIPPSGDAFAGIDPAAYLAAGADPAAAVANAGARLASARLCDLLISGMRGPIGSAEPRLDVMSYRVALSAAGYTGAVVLDARQWTDPWAGVVQTRDVWR